MKKLIPLLVCFPVIILGACNSDSGKAKENPAVASREAVADSLEQEVIEGHNIAMPKSMKIPALKKEAQRLLDSIGKLPAKAQAAAAPMKSRLQDLQKELDSAYNSMESWMEDFGHKMQEFNADSAKAKIEQKITYLSEQKLKINTVKDQILSSMARADSVLKSKF